MTNDNLSSLQDEVRTDPDGSTVEGRPWSALILIGAALLCVMVMWSVPTAELVGAVAIVLILILMLMKLPIVFAIAIPSLLGLYAISGPGAVANTLTNTPFDTVSSWSLSVLPMFILMGTLLGSSGIISRVYNAARLWLGWLPGGLAVGTNAAGSALAAVSGSTFAITYALGRVGLPEMLRRNYDPKFAVGAVVIAGLPGQLIPPSTFLIIVAGIIGTAVGPQLMAGLVPGIALVLLACLLIVIYALVFPSWAGRGRDQEVTDGSAANRESMRTRIVALSGVWPVALLFIVVFGAMLGGILTATEAGALGALVAVLLTFYYRRGQNPLSHIIQGATQALIASGAIFFVLMGAEILGRMMAVTGIGGLFSEAIASLGLGRVGFLLVVMLMYIILGMFMDPLAILVLTLPILQPSFSMLGIDPIWFGVFAVLMGELAILTPPVGILTFIMHKMMQDKEVSLGHTVSLKDVFVGVSLFFPAILGLVLLIILVPGLVMWLPSLM